MAKRCVTRVTRAVYVVALELWGCGMSKRKIWREGDEKVCSLGYRWGLDEDDPHFDNAVYELKQTLIKTAEETGEPVDKCLATLITKCLLSEYDDTGHVYGPDLVKRIDCSVLGN